MTNKQLERARDFQAELGAICDRFYAAAGLPAEVILEIMSGESEIWEHRRGRELADGFAQDPHQRPHPPLNFTVGQQAEKSPDAS